MASEPAAASAFSATDDAGCLPSRRLLPPAGCGETPATLALAAVHLIQKVEQRPPHVRRHLGRNKAAPTEKFWVVVNLSEPASVHSHNRNTKCSPLFLR